MDRNDNKSSMSTNSAHSLLLFYSQIMGDYDSLVGEYISEGNNRAAIAVLGDAASTSMNKVESLIYQHAPLLLERAPEATAHLMLRVGLKDEILGMYMSVLRICDEYICNYMYLLLCIYICIDT
jgi:hypothetical protein